VAVTPIVERGATAQILGVCRNATEPMYLRSRQQQALARLSERALVESNIQFLFDDAVVAVGDILGVELVKVWVPRAMNYCSAPELDGTWLVGYAIISTAPGSPWVHMAAGQVIVEDLASETRFAGQPILHAHGAVSGISVPIAGQDGRAYGVITAHAPRLVKFHDYDASFLSAVANVLAGAIRRSQLDHRHEMMIRELRHRSGNIFAQLLRYSAT
jgi:GAF domain-containing protein